MSAIRRKRGVTTGPLANRMAAFLERYPKADDIYVTSGGDGDHGAVSHHFGLRYQGSPTAALDLGAGDPPSDTKMRDLAKWLYDDYSDFTVELIHSTHFDDDRGFYVKDQVKNPGGSIYGGPQTIGHFDHVHWATSEELLERLEKVDGPAGTPAAPGLANTAPVWGWDASDHDWDPDRRGVMNLVEAQRDGISFFVHKATEGTTWKSKYYGEALGRARHAGIPVLGTYHFLWPEDVEAQVTAWMDFVDAQTPWWRDVPWIWQVDAERPRDDVRMPNPDEIGRAVAAVRRRMAERGAAGYVVAYAPAWAYGDTLGADYDIWNSNYTGSGSARPFKEQYQGVTDCQAGWNPVSGRKPKILQFASDGRVGSQSTCDVNKFDGDLDALVRLCGRDPGWVDVAPEAVVTEKVLPYDHSPAFVKQETGYFCGPASTQIVLDSRKVVISERDLAGRLGTDRDGTDCVQLIERVLDVLLPEAQYTSIEMTNDPPTQADRDRLWQNVVGSIDAGYGVVMNWVAPPSNHPRGVKGSVSPSYGGARTVFHYVACMGYDSNPALRAVWIADSGFSPHGYWISFDQAATLIPPKAYAYAALAVPQGPASHEPDQPPPVAEPVRADVADAPVGERVAWCHEFSDGITREAGDVLLELMEFIIQWRTANHLTTSALVKKQGRRPTTRRPAKAAANGAAVKPNPK